MLQDFTQSSQPAAHIPRLADLRAELARRGLDGFIVPRTDAHQGEYVAPCDARLAWLSGFTGSAGFAIVTAERAGVFIDGRYRVQVRAETDARAFEPVPWPETGPAVWLADALPDGGRLGYDPWLHTQNEIAALEADLDARGIALIAQATNPVDAVWPDRPAPPAGAVRLHPDVLAGASAQDKRARIAADLRAAGQAAAVLTLPDSISWLLNIRGADIPRNPVVQGFAVIGDDARVSLFADPAKFAPDIRAALGPDVAILPPAGLEAALSCLPGPVRLDPANAPKLLFDLLHDAGTEISAAPDPAILPKACKTPAEIAGMRAAHGRDAVAMVRLLAWLDEQPPGSLTEIDIVRHLESLRIAAGARDISFDTICGAGPNGAIVHYRVTEATNRPVSAGDLLLLDSGGQYEDGTTDITRTVAVGDVGDEARAAFTRVLQGMIGISRLKFPRGLAGRDIDAVARAPLWSAGMDYDHGTGHGVGAALCVHEGPARISRLSEVPLEAGMILSNEPGFYREGEFGIRIENLLIVTGAEGFDGRPMLGFETLTFVPVDRRLIDPALLAPAEIAWLDDYHAQLRGLVAPHVDGAVRDWLIRATAPL
ncbi:MAG: aminopeptidase P family protein [Paracoccus sp. (in: a-proteobacteria)]|nr:aminopeptidase P family protein [Paracoccus sp. (in: a-proteobacteria)]